jgi:hypothetical protein
MTRHGVFQLQAAGAAPPAKDPRTPVVTITVDSVATSCVPGRQYTAEAQRSGLSASIPTLPNGGRANADIGSRSKSP